MTVVGEGFSVGQGQRSFPRPIVDAWRTIAFGRINLALETAVPVPFDNNSRIVFFSDCHRGDNKPGGRFCENKPIFQAALNHYFYNGFTYIEVGDGDELWQNGRFSDILDAHNDVFDLLHRFDDDGRLYLLVGNHDTYNAFQHQSEKDGIPTYHSLLLTHRQTDQTLLVLHGHQADMTSSRYYTVSRVVCRSLWRWAQMQGISDALTNPATSPQPNANMQTAASRFIGQGKRIEQRIIEWVTTRQIPVICGHTHLAALPGPNMPPYFNSGSCVRPGFITGLELQGGELSLVKWSLDGEGEATRVRLAPPRALTSLVTA